MRTYNEIYQSIIDKKDATPELSWFNSASLTAIWRFLAHITASAIFVFEEILHWEKSEIETKMAREQYGFIDWYALVAKDFQYGDSLVFDSDSGTYAYAVIDESKRIITASAAVENELTAQIKLKVAKGVGTLEKLSAAELTAFEAYMAKVKIAGTNLINISQDGDVVAVNGTLKYNSQYALADIKTAISEVLAEFQSSYFYNSILRRNDIISHIRSAAGVVDFIPSILTGQPDGGVAVDISDDYEVQAGYFNYSQANPENQFTYEAV